MQEDDFKSKKSDIGDTDKKKKYELRNRKQNEDMSDISMTVTDAISILDKHKTVKIVEENVNKKGNDEQEVNSDIQPRRRTRSSTAKQTITETLDEIFEPVNSDNRDKSREKKKNDEKQAGKGTTLLESYADGTANNINAEQASGGKRTQEKLAAGSDSKKGKKTKQNNKKSIEVPDDDTEQTDAGNNRCQTHSTTLRTKNSDNASKLDGDRTVTDENPEEGTNQTADDEQNNEQQKLDPPIAKKRTRKRKGVSTQDGQNDKNETTNDVQADEEIDDTFHCHICKKTFMNYNNFRAYKIKCWAMAKKHQCEKCGKGFDAKSIMQQHYDYRHTNKPKRFICDPCKKSFELKKTLDEHNMRLHSKGSYKFQCDYCGRGFFHLNKFKMHRAGHTKIKEYICGQCKIMAFSSVGKLNAHLKICGRPNSFKCTICGKFYSSSSNLTIHVSDVHKNEITWSCPVCEDKVYSSKGSYHHHLREKQKIGRNGDKLTDEKIKEL